MSKALDRMIGCPIYPLSEMLPKNKYVGYSPQGPNHRKATIPLGKVSVPGGGCPA